jgi:hypothetical protein
VVVKDARSDRLAHQLEFKGAEHKSATFAPDYPRAFGTSPARAGKGLVGGLPGAGRGLGPRGSSASPSARWSPTDRPGAARAVSKSAQGVLLIDFRRAPGAGGEGAQCAVSSFAKPSAGGLAAAGHAPRAPKVASEWDPLLQSFITLPSRPLYEPSWAQPFGPGGDLALTTSAFGEHHLWEVASGRLLEEFRDARNWHPGLMPEWRPLPR